MSLAWARRAALGIMLAPLLVSPSACSSNDDANGHPGPASPAKDSGGAAGAQVRFDADGTLTASPSQALSLGISVTGGDADVSVWLEGDYQDASLGADTVSTQSGHGAVVLHTSSMTATFKVGAKLEGGTAAYLEVSVSSDGFAIVRVLPAYPGRRAAIDFRASVFPNTTCDALKKQPIKDGGLAADGKFAEPIVIKNVPAGTSLAIGVRSARFATGCADVTPLVPSMTTDVPVTVLDVPMALDKTDLDMTLAFEPEDADRAAWVAMLDAAVQQSGAAFFASGESGALLDAMRTTIAAAADRTQFDQGRTQGNWDSKVESWLASHAPSLHDRALSWMTAVKSDAIGALTLHLTPGASGTTGTSGTVSATPVSFGALSAASAGLTLGASPVWTADAADTVHPGGTMAVAPTPLVAHLADAHAIYEVPQATGVASALASGIDCAGLASTIAGSGAIYGQCTANCAADACRDAIAVAWTKATDPATGVAPTSVTITASGSAKVGDDAEPLTVDGSWVGQVSAATGSSAMKGAMTAKKPGTN